MSMMRETYIVAKALAIAIKVLEQERPHRQHSDLEDMRELLARTKLPLVLFGEQEFISGSVAEAIQRTSARLWAKSGKILPGVLEEI